MAEVYRLELPFQNKLLISIAVAFIVKVFIDFSKGIFILRSVSNTEIHELQPSKEIEISVQKKSSEDKLFLIWQILGFLLPHILSKHILYLE